jgi:hypothetical protein
MIKEATRYDMDSLVSMTKQYAAEFPSRLASDPSNFDADNIKSLYFSIMAGRGFILLDTELKGFLVAIILNNTWFPKILEMHELAWWVMPEFRNTSIGGKLWLEFNRRADEYIESGRIKAVITSLAANSPAIDYKKRGYKMLETSYLKEA